MKPERIVVAAAIGVAVVSIFAAVAVPDAVADQTDDPRPGHVDIEEVPIEPGEATGETATLGLEARLDHRGNPTENVTVLFRATDSDSRLVETEQTVDAETLRGDRETPVEANLTVEREGGYEIETVVFQDGQRVDRATRRVSGLEALTPAYAESNTVFADTGALQPVSVAVGSADEDDDEVDLDVSGSLTNEGDDSTDDLEVTYTARQADSNVVADRETVDVEEIRNGRTAGVEAELTVPNEYNYYIDAVLWRDDVHVDSVQGVANLDPSERISANETEAEVAFEASDFSGDELADSEDDEAMNDDAEEESADASTGEETPGFGIAVGLVAVLATVLLSWRRST
ncbi:MAG: DUF7490 domain-containing protein [Halohasta sp.]